MIKTIHEHKVDTDLLPENAKILDIGCRNFLFVDHFRRRGFEVYAVDIDQLDRKDYHRVGISSYTGLIGVQNTRDPQATHTILGGSDVECMTLEKFSTDNQIKFWDVVKIDVEGDERAIIGSLHTAPARQISIEFHLHINDYYQTDVDKIVDKLTELGYYAASHELTNEHGAGQNYWSSLFILAG